MISEKSFTKSGMKENFLNTLIIYICVKNKTVHAFYDPHYILFKHVLKRFRKHMNSLYLHIKFLYVYKLLNLCYLYISKKTSFDHILCMLDQKYHSQ
jgi:hypothetical protein